MPSFFASGHDPGGSHRPFARLAKQKQSVSTESHAPKEENPIAATPPKLARDSESEASDEQQFLQAIAGTSQITNHQELAGPSKPDPRVKPSVDSHVLAELADLCDGRGVIAEPDEHIEDIAPGMDRRLLKRLRAGQYAVQAHLDLHGMTRDEARERVAKFIAKSRAAQRRCVLIVHGRGQHSEGQVPILKQKLHVWLQRGMVARSVLAFATACPTDGGAGAVYVLLRK